MAVPTIKINEVLQKWASNEFPIQDFTVSNVLNSIGLPKNEYKAVFDYLMSKKGFELDPHILLYCPQNHKGETFMLSDPIDHDDFFDCWCGEEYYFDPDNMVLVFSFTDSFREESVKKKLYIIQYPSIKANHPNRTGGFCKKLFERRNARNCPKWRYSLHG